jgi:hypothetical protein
MNKAKGIFSVKMTPRDLGEGSAVGAMNLDKKYSGPLEAAGSGEMLAIQSGVEGSAGYVAMERVTGNLDGKNGSFALMHFGVMDRGTPSLHIKIVPDSGTGELTGISGTLTINIENGEHFYEIEYDLD